MNTTQSISIKPLPGHFGVSGNIKIETDWVKLLDIIGQYRHLAIEYSRGWNEEHPELKRLDEFFSEVDEKLAKMIDCNRFSIKTRLEQIHTSQYIES